MLFCQREIAHRARDIQAIPKNKERPPTQFHRRPNYTHYGSNADQSYEDRIASPFHGKSNHDYYSGNIGRTHTVSTKRLGHRRTNRTHYGGNVDQTCKDKMTN